MTTKTAVPEEAKASLKEISLEDALSIGIVVLKEEVESTIAKELKTRQVLWEKKVRKDVYAKLEYEVRESANKKIKIAENKRYEALLIGYLEGTNITELEFGKRLMTMSVPKELLTNLLDVHSKWTNIQIWDYIRANA